MEQEGKAVEENTKGKEKDATISKAIILTVLFMVFAITLVTSVNTVNDFFETTKAVQHPIKFIISAFAQSFISIACGSSFIYILGKEKIC